MKVTLAYLTKTRSFHPPEKIWEKRTLGPLLDLLGHIMQLTAQYLGPYKISNFGLHCAPPLAQCFFFHLICGTRPVSLTNFVYAKMVKYSTNFDNWLIDERYTSNKANKYWNMANNTLKNPNPLTGHAKAKFRQLL